MCPRSGIFQRHPEVEADLGFARRYGSKTAGTPDAVIARRSVLALCGAASGRDNRPCMAKWGGHPALQWRARRRQIRPERGAP